MSEVLEGVRQLQSRIVVLDSLSGFFAVFPDEAALTSRFHDFLVCLGEAGVLTFLLLPSRGIFGMTESDVDASYLADTVITMRHFEFRGEMRRCISVLKKRFGSHESTIREVGFGPGGLRIGKPLTGFTGVLAGLPRFEGTQEELF